MNDMHFDRPCPQSARQPDAVAAGFEGPQYALDLAAGVERFVVSAVQQPEKGFRIGGQLLQWIACEAGNDCANEPFVQTQFNH
jgi:hypothetical protein